MTTFCGKHTANQYRIVGWIVGWHHFTVEVIIEILCPRPRFSGNFASQPNLVKWTLKNFGNASLKDDIKISTKVLLDVQEL